MHLMHRSHITAVAAAATPPSRPALLRSIPTMPCVGASHAATVVSTSACITRSGASEALLSPSSILHGSLYAAPQSRVFRGMPAGCFSPQRWRRVVAAAQKQQFSSFEEMLRRSDLPLLVDFYATWCGPCQIMSPILSSVASKLKGRLQVVKIDTDRYPTIASQHGVQALPTIALFVRGKIIFRSEGVLTEGQLMERLTYYLAAAGAGTGSGPANN
ncbi:hypothetical protein Vretimale_7350 [Volvox reticuliferus]|uniref:Uncharacterized protein n=1 Tax=Volvox reticuliferus TaxID=1737510 RepID=A0A8J4FMA7_9CHLO|nr:hypothetical protein Vretifemale_7459 [Volvox reticuliferus]GIM02530.1 hypothetical protein Vretimale_7350 [Volvox reticuliferus]